MEIAQITSHTQAWKQSFSFIGSTYIQNKWERPFMRETIDALMIILKVIITDI